MVIIKQRYKTEGASLRMCIARRGNSTYKDFETRVGWGYAGSSRDQYDLKRSEWKEVTEDETKM